ncbi:hypothetical protein [Mycobacterium sp.]|uniref:hypothetical protein n=1 Tax=Mycobacterium sp. TaxID=1785 RepID=UPI003A8A00D4
MMTMLSVADVERREFWNALCPGLSIESGGVGAPAVLGEINPLLANLKREGYVQVPGALPEVTTAPIR